jgi:hypothetical protein
VLFFFAYSVVGCVAWSFFDFLSLSSSALTNSILNSLSGSRPPQDSIISLCFSLQENSPCKLIGITETDNELKVELVIFYTDYASVFSEADREDKYKESDFKLIVLSMLSELYSCSMGINNFISKTLLSALENIKKGTKDEEKR